jgi:hypothetical protein
MYKVPCTMVTEISRPLLTIQALLKTGESEQRFCCGVVIKYRVLTLTFAKCGQKAN